MSKALEDLELLTVDQLKGIATDLGLNPKSNIKKPELVQLVYDAQQPAPNEPEVDMDDWNFASDEAGELLLAHLERKAFTIADAKTIEGTGEDGALTVNDIGKFAAVFLDKPITSQADFETRLEDVVLHFGGTIALEDGENEDGATIYDIVDELTEESVKRGTFLELWDEMQGAPIGTNAPSLDAPEESDEPAPPAVEERVLETPALGDPEARKRIEDGLKPLANFGLKYEVNGSVIKLRAGSKVQTTTLNQPAHRVVRIAEQLCNFR